MHFEQDRYIFYLNKSPGIIQNKVGILLQSLHSSFPVIYCTFPHWETYHFIFISFFATPYLRNEHIQNFCSVSRQMSRFSQLILSRLAQLFSEETRHSGEAVAISLIYVSTHCCIRRDGHRLQAGNLLLLEPQPKHSCPVPMEQFHPRAQSGKAIRRESKQFATASYLMD